jgi:hypothetical protein
MAEAEDKTDENPINMILQATSRVAEALRLLERAMMIATLNTSEFKAVTLDFAFLDCPLDQVDWGLDYAKRLSKIFDNWNHHEAARVNAADRRFLRTIRDLLTISEDTLRRQPNVGTQVITRINAVLGKHGLRLNV